MTQDDIIRPIQKLRREKPESLDEFRELVKSAPIESFDTRWLTSVIETFADHGDEGERQAAMMLAVFAQMTKLMDSAFTKNEGSIMYKNVHSFNRQKDDMINNFLYRIRRETPESLEPCLDRLLANFKEQSPAWAWLSERYPAFWEEKFYPGRPSYEDQ